MWPFPSSKSRSRALGTMPIDLSKVSKPDPVRRPPVRVFVSHRWDRDEQFHRIVTGSLRAGGLDIQDMSLLERERISGPRGGQVEEARVQLDLSKRIDQSDIFIAPADKLMADAEWIRYEMDCAARAHKPMLFLSDDPNRQQYNRKIGEYERAGCNIRRSTTDPEAILANVKAMLPARRH